MQIFVYDPKHDWVGSVNRLAVVEELVEAHPEAIYFFAELSPAEFEDVTIRCPKCNSDRWVPVSYTGGMTRFAQCVPCGTVHTKLK